jgi:hypothetical protein
VSLSSQSVRTEQDNEAEHGGPEGAKRSRDWRDRSAQRSHELYRRLCGYAPALKFFRFFCTVGSLAAIERTDHKILATSPYGFELDLFSSIILIALCTLRSIAANPRFHRKSYAWFEIRLVNICDA